MQLHHRSMKVFGMTQSPSERARQSGHPSWLAGLILAITLFGHGPVMARGGEPATASPSVGVQGRGVDFDAALKGVRFNPAKADGNLDSRGKANGLLDADEMALTAAVLNEPDLDLGSRGGVSHRAAAAAFDQAMASAARDTERLAKSYPTVASVVTGYAMLGEASFQAFNAMSSAFGAPLSGDYGLAVAMGRYFGPDGDADGDGASNRSEYAAYRKDGRAAYVRAALDPQVRPKAGQAVSTSAPDPGRRKLVGIVLYPGFEVLDVFGPLEMWANEPGFEVVLIAETAGDVRSAQGVVVKADYGFGSAPKLDIMMVPGGAGTMAQLENPLLLDFLKLQDRQTQFTTSVCTGSALLAKAGLLKGRKATTNKAYFSLASDQDSSVRWMRRARWVEDGKFFTSSGVSAGTDMALGLVARIYGQDHARALARSLEYQWSEDADNDPFALP